MYVPRYPGSQFWIRYSCVRPRNESQIRYYYFKLFLGGEPVVSWGCGEKDGWIGKTMFAPFHTGTDSEGTRLREMRGFFFPSDDGVGKEDWLEIRVFRSKARRRDPRVYQGLPGRSTDDGSVRSKIAS